MARKRKDKAAYNRYMNDYMKLRYATNIELIRKYKIGKGCIDCGYNKHHAGLQFDHLVPRNGNTNLTIGKMANRGMKRVMKEIAQCEVVCGTCHGIRTWERRSTPP
jgi:hypothetical protein